MEVQFDRQQGANAWLTVGLREGKNREIRRVMEFLGVTVNRLIRVSYGPFQLGELPVGAVKEVSRRALRDQLGLVADADEQKLTRRVRGERPVKVRKLQTGPVMRTTKGGLRPGEGGAARPKVVAAGAEGDAKPWVKKPRVDGAPGEKPRPGKPARAGRTADRPGWSPDKAEAVAAAREGGAGERKPRSAGFKSHRATGGDRPGGDAPRAGKVAGAGRSAGYKSHRDAGGAADEGGPRKGPYKPRGPVAGPRGDREGYKSRGPRPEGGYKSRGPRVEGEGYKARGPRPEGGYKSRGRRVEGEGNEARGPKPEGGYKSRGPRAEGDRPRGPKPEGGYTSRGPRAEGEGYKSRGPKPDGDRPRGPKPEGTGAPRGPRPDAEGGDAPRKARHKSKAAGFKSDAPGAGGKKPRE
jgi:23S rRNA pseudouridine2605 synthase